MVSLTSLNKKVVIKSIHDKDTALPLALANKADAAVASTSTQADSRDTQINTRNDAGARGMTNSEQLNLYKSLCSQVYADFRNTNVTLHETVVSNTTLAALNMKREK